MTTTAPKLTAPDVSTPAGIIRLGNAFCDAKALLTAVELDLFGVLHQGPASSEKIKDRLKLHGRGLSDFLQLLVNLGLLVQRDGRFSNSEGSDKYLVREVPTYIGGFLIRSNRNLYPAWGKLDQALRTGEKQSGGEFGALTKVPHLLKQFIGMMDALTTQLAPELSAAIDWSPYRTLLDVGGCRGNLASQLVKAQPHLQGHVFDLPAMKPFFTEHMEAMGLSKSMYFHGGSFFTESLPRADVVVLGHVLHDWAESQREFLVKQAFKAVNPGGVLLVYDRMLGAANLVENLVISLDMLLVTDGGSEYPAEEIHRHAAAAGFASVRDEPLGDYDTLVICTKS